MEEHKFRQKLFTDLFRLKQYQSTIALIYPTIEKINIKLKFTYDGVTQWKEDQSLTYYPEDKAFFKIVCINTECVYTDFELKEEITKMVGIKERVSNGLKICNGYQDYSRYLSRGNYCSTEMEYEIEIIYK